jgi:VWFA-related protein
MRVLIVISLSISAIVAASPQRAFSVKRSSPPQSDVPVIRSEVNLQTVSVQVKDKRGNNLVGLEARDFKVLENGKPQKVAFFDAGSGPVTVAVLVDSSSSMVTEGRVASAAEIAARFMRIARPRDEIWAMDFTDRTGPFEKITQEQINSGPVKVPSAGGVGSAVYDAIATALCQLQSSSNPRRAIIVITDGIDEHSRLSLNQLVDLVRSQRVQLFLVGFPSRPEFRSFDDTQPKVTLVTGHDIDNPDFVFDRLAKEGRAEAFIPKSESGLQQALKAVLDLLQSEYTLAYYLPRTPGKLRRIEVNVDRRGARVLKNRFIVANPDAAELVHYVEGTCTVSPEFHPYPYDSHVTEGPGGIVYRDDLLDPRSGWPQHPGSHYVSGGYELSTLQRTGTDVTPRPMIATGGMSSSSTSIVRTYRDNIVAAYGPSWHNFRVSATIKPEFERPHRWDINRQFSRPVRPTAGLVFRMNEKGYYALLVSSSTERKNNLAFALVAMTFQGDSFAQSMIMPWTTVDRASPKEVQIAVQDIANEITISVNGKQVGVTHDDRFADGYVGFTVSAPAHASFSNLLVEQR